MINWPMLINELKREGVSLLQIATEAECDRRTVRQLRDVPDFDPRYKLGVSIISMGRKHLTQEVFERAGGDVSESRGSGEEHY